MELIVGAKERSRGAIISKYVEGMLRKVGSDSEVNSFCRSAIHRRLGVDATKTQTTLDNQLHASAAGIIAQLDAKSLREYFAGQMKSLREDQRKGVERAMEVLTP